MRFIVLDCEMGGLTLDKSLLSIGMVIADETFQEIDYREIKLKPDDKIYHCTAEALSINKINIIEHDRGAITYKEGKTDIYNFLVKSTDGCSTEKLIPVGKNLYGDLQQIWDKTISRPTWECYVSTQVIDLTGIVKWLTVQKKLPPLEKTSLTALAKHFSLPIENLHNALDDARLTLKVFRKLMEI